MRRHPGRQRVTVLGPLHDLIKLPDKDFAESAPDVLAQWFALAEGTGAGQLNPLVRDKLRQKPPASKVDVAKLYGELFASTYDASKADDPTTLGLCEWWIPASEERRRPEPDLLERVLEDRALEPFHIGGDLGELRQSANPFSATRSRRGLPCPGNS